ncbi:MAG: hypothetical protein WHS46_10910 [Desulfosoma sp.]
MKIFYHHRTQGRWAERKHIRGMVSGMPRLGCDVDVLDPPGVHLDTQQGQHASAPRSKTLALIAERGPQAFFEILELAYNIYVLLRLGLRLKKSAPHLIYERDALFSFAGSLVSRIYGIPLFLEVNDATVARRSRPLVNKALANKIER